MDFPMVLENESFVTSTNEFRQCLQLILVNPLHTFLQNYQIGSLVSIHSTNEDAMENNIRETLKELDGVSVSSIAQDSEGQYSVSVYYKGSIVNFTFNINTVSSNE